MKEHGKNIGWWGTAFGEYIAYQGRQEYAKEEESVRLLNVIKIIITENLCNISPWLGHASANKICKEMQGIYLGQ